MDPAILVEALGYSTSTETIEAVVAGMNAGPSDRVLAVAGSGDQAFALLENAGHVLAVDSVAPQVDYLQRRAELLMRGDYEGFLGYQAIGVRGKIFAPPVTRARLDAKLEKRRKFFTADRLSRIRKRLNSLNTRACNVFDMAAEGGFTRVYLSNAIGYHTNEKPWTILDRITGNLPEGGLIYVANNAFEFDKPESLPPGLEFEQELTRLARGLEEDKVHWNPAVYRKCA